MNVLITGAAGFVGSHLANRFLDLGHQVVGIDNFSTSLGRSAPHVLALKARQRFEMVDGDICDMQMLDGVCMFFKPKLILNFACPASPPRYQALPIETMMTCVVGTRNLLEQARYERAVVIHASTSEVYGDPVISPQVESYRGCVNSYGPRACYDEGKRAAEALCHDYRYKFGVRAKVIRIFNTYGPHMDPKDGRVVSNFICQALADRPLTLYGGGKQTRSFCYVDDLIDGIVAVSKTSDDFYGPVNLGNPEEFTIEQLATKINRLLDRHDVAGFVDCPLPADDPLQRKPDIGLAQRELGFEPKITIDEGLIKTIEYFRLFL